MLTDKAGLPQTSPQRNLWLPSGPGVLATAAPTPARGCCNYRSTKPGFHLTESAENNNTPPRTASQQGTGHSSAPEPRDRQAGPGEGEPGLRSWRRGRAYHLRRFTPHPWRSSLRLQ